MSETASRIDRRSFHWPLAAALAKLEIDGDRARLVLAESKRLAATSQQAAAEQQRRVGRAQASAADMTLGSFDPQAYSRSLAGLVRLRQRADAECVQHRGFEVQALCAAQACAVLHRRVEIMQGLLRRAERQHDKGLLQRQCREDDLAWLARGDAQTSQDVGAWSRA